MNIRKRNINIDLIKCIAVFSVISVHFFKNNGFYNNIILGTNMYVLTTFRTLFMICVPLFMITTGYLMKNKELSKKYYLGILRVLITYILSTILLLLYNTFYLKESFSIKYLIKSILGFELGYCWYIEMYIGLFLLIPFLNLIYNNLKFKKHKIILISTLLLLTAFPGVFNIKYDLIPDWWIGIYPFTYYFMGCYLKEYKININKVINIIIIFVSLIISSFINIYLSFGNTFIRGIQNDWGSIFNVITTVLIFVFVLNLNLNNINIRIKRIIVKVSELSLAIYLSSAVVDDFLYFNYYEGRSFLNMMGYIKIIPMAFILSISLSIIINCLYKLINKYIITKMIRL